jgi:hypothetical protein
VAVLTNAGNHGEPAKLATQMVAAALELEPPIRGEWSAGEPPPAELAGILGHWWSEGLEFTLSFRKGRLEARSGGDPPDKAPSLFEREGPDRYRTTSGKEQGELLEIVRDEHGEAVKLYWATYPCTRAFRTFGDAAS